MSAPTGQKTFRILVVDDSEFARTQIAALLQQRGYAVVGSASSAEDAVRQIKDKKPHLVITDIVMPNVSGLELAESIATNFNGVGVIVVSSLTHEQIVLEAISAGAIDFIKKPIDPEQLVESIEKFFAGLKKESP